MARHRKRPIPARMEVRMSLTKKKTMTQKKIFANQANGKRSHGPATPEGRERIRAANIRHGFYSQAETVALACLGEDPADLERLRKNLHDDVRVFPRFARRNWRSIWCRWFGGGSARAACRRALPCGWPSTRT